MTDAVTFKFIARIEALELLLIEDLTRWVRSQDDPRGFAEQYREKLRGQLEKMTMEGIEEPVHADEGHAEMMGNEGWSDERSSVPLIERVRAWREGEPPVIEFYGDPNDEEALQLLCQNLKAFFRHATEDAYASLCQAAQYRHIPDQIDQLVQFIRDNSGIGGRSAVYRLATRLFRSATEVEPLKLGIVLFHFGASDEDIADLEMIARYPVFMRFAVVVLANLLPEPAETLCRIAEKAQNTERLWAVQFIARMTETRPDLRDWLLRRGYDNGEMELALLCAVAGNLAGALESDADDLLLDQAANMLRKMMADGRPMFFYGREALDGWLTIAQSVLCDTVAHDLLQYADGFKAVASWLTQVEHRKGPVTRLAAIVGLTCWIGWLEIDTSALSEEMKASGWSRRAQTTVLEAVPTVLKRAEELGWSKVARSAVLARCRALLADPAWAAAVHEAVKRDDGDELAWRCSISVGADLWETGDTRLSNNPANVATFRNLVGHAACSPNRLRALADRAIRSFALTRYTIHPGTIAPSDSVPVEVMYFVDEMLGVMARSAVFDDTFVAIGLASSDYRYRIAAVEVLRACRGIEWGPHTSYWVDLLARVEPKAELRERLAGLRSSYP